MTSPNELPLTAFFVKDPSDNGFTGFFAEFPGAVAQGDTVDEVENELFKALNFMLKFNKEDAQQDISDYPDSENIVSKHYSLKPLQTA